MTILVTGATGLIAQGLLTTLHDKGVLVRSTSRRNVELPWRNSSGLCLTARTDWKEALSDVDTVVHLAGRVHQTSEGASSHRYVEENGCAAVSLAAQARDMGVMHFILMSTAKVYGEGSPLGHSLVESDPLSPSDPYAFSKVSAELGVRAVAHGSDMALTILRIPVVYSASAKGNIARMANYILSRRPIPMVTRPNRRSILSLRNAVSAVEAVIESGLRDVHVLNVADREPVSTEEMVRAMAAGFGVRPRLVHFPGLDSVRKVPGVAGVAQRLYGDFWLNTTRAARVIGWTAPGESSEELRIMAQHLLKTRSD